MTGMTGNGDRVDRKAGTNCRLENRKAGTTRMTETRRMSGMFAAPIGGILSVAPFGRKKLL